MSLGLALKHEPTPEEIEKKASEIDKYYAASANLNLKFIPAGTNLIEVVKLPDVSLYILDQEHASGPTAPYKLFRSKGLYLAQVEIDNLALNGVEHIYIAREDVSAFTRYIEERLQELPISSPIADEKKVGALRKSAIVVIDDIFKAPTPENIQRGVKVVSGFVYTLMKDPKAYQLLLGLSSHDPYTLQHSVGAAANAIILAKKLGINDEQALIEAGLGGLLHDIGKTKVPTSIINKKGPLDEAEWALMKQHALHGYEIIKDNPDVGTRAKLAVLQHHEDIHGTGYPLGLRGTDVSLFAKIVSLCDIFNAITTDRSYSIAKPPFEAFQVIREKLMHKVDPKIFEAMVLIYGGKGPT